jgi:hypothetical protein
MILRVLADEFTNLLHTYCSLFPIQTSPIFLNTLYPHNTNSFPCPAIIFLTHIKYNYMINIKLNLINAYS